MIRLITLLLALALAGCEATAIKKTADLKTVRTLSPDISLPVPSSVAIYVDKRKPEKGVNFYEKLQEVGEMVAGDMFSNAEPLSPHSDFRYLISLSAQSDWDRVWGGWISTLHTTIIDRRGKTLYRNTLEKKVNGGGLYDFDAVHNSLAIVVKESLIDFLNLQGQASLANTTGDDRSPAAPLPSLKALLPNVKPGSTGTGFFINGSGDLVTAAHVVNECYYVEVNHQGQTLPATIKQSSAILDVAVVGTSSSGNAHATFGEDTAPRLGTQVFVTGYPLSGILADYPSLTVGNISSLGGLKGAQGHFQFSAPVQPGNSGGAIVDYRGNLQGLVTSSLNQSVMLQQAGTTAQNVNFGVDLALLRKFFDKNQVPYTLSEAAGNFDASSAAAVDYTSQVLCYN